MIVLLVPELLTNRRALARLLHFPENVGVRFHDLALGDDPLLPALLVWVEGLAQDATVVQNVLAPLSAYRGRPALEDVRRALPVMGASFAPTLGQVTEQLLSGRSALLADGWHGALILETAAREAQASDRAESTFTRDLRVNVGLLRRRTRTPRLLALRVRRDRPDAAEAALVFLAQKARPHLIRHLRRWVRTCVNEDLASRGMAVGAGTLWGMLPRLAATGRPDEAAMLLDHGYVLLLVDRLPHVFAAPLTLSVWLSAPGDVGMVLPARRALKLIRLLLHLLVLILPGAVVALMNYHVEMVPTAFLAAVASARENSPLGLYFEVLLLELFVDISRHVSFLNPAQISPGLLIVALVLIITLSVQTGFVGPVPALAAAVGALISLGLPWHNSAHVVRTWRYFLLFGSVVLGFFGMAAVFTIFLAYLLRASTWGVPFAGPAGALFRSGEARASGGRPQSPGGGRGA